MATSLQHPLTSAATSTFEELGFLLAVEAAGSSAPCEHAARVRFRGPRAGSLVLQVSASLLPVVAANMLGAAEAPGLELQRDALGELANVIAGNVVPALDGPRAVYQLEAPRACAALPASDPAATVRLTFDEGAALVHLYLDDPSAAAT
ncbi:MAG TPA: chemotaxis protein CheX [Gemmatimonadaceae bacterium]|nr:chemotaxis protein CheX [Gemmatimonadaceae bacterium]